MRRGGANRAGRKADSPPPDATDLRLKGGQVKTPVISAAPERSGKGHFLQPQWDGGDSIRERLDAVKPFLDGSSVLDVGCASRYGRADWLHGLLAAETADLVGIDVNGRVVDTLQAEGFDVRLADARDFDLGRQFDVVFAGELIEHLDDVRGFLSSVRRHLAPGGRLVLTTPNAFYVGNFVYRLGGHSRVHPEHTGWYCEDTLRRVLTTNGFPAPEIYYTGHVSRTPLRRLASFLAQHLLSSELALDTLVAVARVARVAPAPDRGAGA
jgi:2-polyprenyl-3-methyl-5-hydroxy-6-metoxy-1,4-benzoquinol methylase